MPIDPNFKDLNRSSTERVKTYARLTDAEMQTRVGEHWTVAMALVHIAFWDRRVMYCLDRTEKEGKLYIPEIEIAVNDLSLPFWAAIPSKDALQLAIENAEAVDKRLENYPQNLLEEVYNHNERWVLRAIHRDTHLDEVDAALKASKR
jgi:hypothetical protein